MKKMYSVFLILSLLVVQKSWSDPKGTYMETSTDIKFDGSALTARCEKEDKTITTSHLTEIDEDDFIINDNGRLVVAPSGPYTDSSENIRFDGSDLSAYVSTENGIRYSSLSGVDKNDIVINDNGRLKVTGKKY